MKKTVIHRDGTVSYWDVHTQSYREHIELIGVSDMTIATLSARDRDRVIGAQERAYHRSPDYQTDPV
jgi:hypothetical protein